MRFWLIRTVIVSWISAHCFLAAEAHDTWVETNSTLIRLGDNVFVDLKLGNHGNDHRDFKLASKVGLDSFQLEIVRPNGETVDLKPVLFDAGLTAKEGYWNCRFTTKESGAHLVASTAVSVYGKTRSIKSAKTCFLVSTKLDELTSPERGFDKPLGHELEIIPITAPVSNASVGQPIRVRVLLRSQPLKNARVSFIPRGTVLDAGFDKAYERETAADGVAEFSPKEGNVILIAVHHSTPEQKGEGFENTKYSATLTVTVPQQNPFAPRTISAK